MIKTYSVIGFKVQHQLYQCCMVVLSDWISITFESLFCLEVFILLLLFLALAQATTVGPVLSVNEHLYPKLRSQQFFSVLFLSLLDGFNLSLEGKGKKDYSNKIRRKISKHLNQSLRNDLPWQFL